MKHEHMNYMNNRSPTLLARNDQTLAEALEALRQTTGVAGAVEPPPTRAGGTPMPSIVLHLGREPIRYTVDVRRIDRVEALGAVRNRLAEQPAPGLLVAPYLTAAVADRCCEIGLQFIDLSGNAYLRGEDYLVHVHGRRPKPGTIDTASGGTATANALRVVFAILCHPEFLNAPYREIARAAGGVALGAIGGILKDLEQRRLVLGGAKGQRRLVEPRRLLDEWVANHPVRLRPKLQIATFDAPDPDWWQTFDLKSRGGQWGAEVAVDRYTNNLRPERVTLYLDPADRTARLRDIVTTARLRPARNGAVEILDRFWNFPGAPGWEDVVPPMLAYADLVASLEPRNLDAAEQLYRERIRDVLAPA